MRKKNIDLSIIISNYNNFGLLRKTIISLKHYISTLKYEIILIDDTSTDSSVIDIKKEFPNYLLKVNKKNLGYSKSYNIGTKIAKGRYILHLNSDIVFIGKQKLDYLVKFMDDNSKIGITGCKILKPDGRLDLPCKRAFPTISNIFWQTIGLNNLFPKNRLFGKYYLSYLNENEIQPVDCLMGAFMLIRKNVFKQIGLLDEQFFIYGEDIDFCYRTKKAGWQIYYNPKLIIQHHHGGTTNKSRFKHILKFHHAMFLYYKKHLAAKNYPIVNVFVYWGITARTIGNFVLDFITNFELSLKKIFIQKK